MKEIVTAEIEAGEIQIDPKMICRLMGIDPDDIPEIYAGIIQKELEEIRNYRNIKGGFRISGNIEIVSPKGIFLYEGEEFRAGDQVAGRLKGSGMLAFYICTAGEEVSRRPGQMIASGNVPEGYVADLIGSLLVEGAADILHDRLRDEMMRKGLRITNRYSPGYCNWDVADQHKLFGFFPVDFCGVRLSDSALMIPVKSVSGVTGIGKKVRFHKYICHACNSVDCIYRNIKYAG